MLIYILSHGEITSDAKVSVQMSRHIVSKRKALET